MDGGQALALKGRSVRLPLEEAVARALLPGARSLGGGIWRVETEADARALALWFGAQGWRGDPAEPASPGPEGEAALLAWMAADVAVIAAEPTPWNTPIHWPGLRMRAQSALAARRRAPPVARRVGFDRARVEVVRRRLPYARYFDTEDMLLRHPTFSGGVSEPVLRTCLRAADAVTVLPYDPRSDRVLMVEQFRPAAFSRGDPFPWVLEPVAGRIDRDEPPEEVARREAREEAGLALETLHLVGSYYPSPGTLSEYLTSYIGICALDGVKDGVHGLDAEAEDIRTHVMGFEEAFALIATGEADNGPLLLSLYWLAANRARLRGQQSPA